MTPRLVASLWSRSSSVARLSAGAVILAAVAVVLAPASRAVAGPMFNECPAIGHDTGCELLIEISQSGTVTVEQDPSQGPYDGTDDTLVGVEVASGLPGAVTQLALSSSTEDIFGFDGDGICTYATGGIAHSSGFTGDGYCTTSQLSGTDPGDYEGPDNTYSNITDGNMTGDVDFTTPLGGGATTFFSLENNLTSAELTGAVSTLSTSLSGGGQSGSPLSVTAGTAVSDAATLAGVNVSSAQGTVTYDVYSDSACTVEVDAGSAQSFTGGAVPPSAPVTLDTPGTYYWQASYTSSNNANSDSESACGSEVEEVVAPSGCSQGTSSCSASFSDTSQTVDVSGTKPTTTAADIALVVSTQTLSCKGFDYPGPVASVTDTGLQPNSGVLITDTVFGLPSQKGVLVCYEPSGASAPSPMLLKKCRGKNATGPCVKSIVEDSGSVVVELLVPAGDPEYHVGGGAPSITSFSPTSPKPGKKLTIKGANLSEVTGVTIGGTAVTILKEAPTKVVVSIPSGLQGGVVAVSSAAGGAVSATAVTVA